MTSALDGLTLPPEAAANGYKTLAERAFLTLRSAILAGRIDPGARLMIEPIAARLEMSPMPVRDALQKLVEVGLVEQTPHRGARVTELTIADLRDVYEVRIALESLAIARAATQFTEDDAEAARLRIERFAAACANGDDETAWAEH